MASVSGFQEASEAQEVWEAQGTLGYSQTFQILPFLWNSPILKKIVKSRKAAQKLEQRELCSLNQLNEIQAKNSHLDIRFF